MKLTRSMNQLFENKLLVFICLLIFRIINALFIQTSFVPDEYWQTIEIAHKWVFGYGSVTWEWRPENALRSPFHPLLITLLYELFLLFGIDTPWLIAKGPQFLHSILAAITDYYLFCLSLNLTSKETAKWTMFHQLSNWFTFYCAPRSLSNCLEWCLFVVGLYHYPWNGLRQSDPKSIKEYKFFIFLVLLCTLIRPTSAIIWLPMCLIQLYEFYISSSAHTGKQSKISTIFGFTKTIIKMHYKTIASCFLFSILLDRITYGRWTMNQLNFVYFNFFTEGANIYGTQPWHWYFTQGFPTILLTQTPFFLYIMYVKMRLKTVSVKVDHGKWKKKQLADKSSSLFILTIIWTLLFYSISPHKEFRFIFPVLPLVMFLCGLACTHLTESYNFFKSRQKYLIYFILITQLPVAIYTSLIHQRGGLDTVQKLVDMLDHVSVGKNASSSIQVLGAMPCHTMPSIGYLHRNISFKQLSCDPNLSDRSAQDEADEFYENPVAWLQQFFHTQQNHPNFVIVFEQLIDKFKEVRNLLTSSNYKLCAELFHAHFLTHNRYSKNIFIYCAQTDLH